jgi:hypothetical protein
VFARLIVNSEFRVQFAWNVVKSESVCPVSMSSVIRERCMSEVISVSETRARIIVIKPLFGEFAVVENLTNGKRAPAYRSRKSIGVNVVIL